MQPDILYEDQEIIVCHKPAGIAAQADRSFLPDMVSLIRNHLAASGQTDSGQIPYVGVVHRLDKPVEGILVYGKTPAAAAFLSRQVSDAGSLKMQKRYRAAVYGTLPADGKDGSFHLLEDFLIHDKRSRCARIAAGSSAAKDGNRADAKPARLAYRCTGHSERNGQPVSLLDIQLFTGRFHQIRAQLSHLGYPIVGDTKYGAPDQKCPLELCACSLTFTHPNGQTMTFSITENPQPDAVSSDPD